MKTKLISYTQILKTHEISLINIQYKKGEGLMKIEKYVVSSAVFMLLILLGIPGWGAPKYLGESTWTVTITIREDGNVSENISGSVKMAITQTGGNYYTVQGYIELPDDGPYIMAGGGALIGETIYLNLTTTQKHTDGNWRDTGMMQVQLNKTTLNGTFYEIGYDFDVGSAGDSPHFADRFTGGTLTLSGSPIIFTSNLTAPMMLLLDK